MNTMAPTRPITLHQPTRPTGPTVPGVPQKPLRPTVLQKRRVTLAAEPVSVGAARGQVKATIQAWDVHDTSCTLPVPMDGPPDAETGRGLVLVASLSSSWGYYRTPTGKAVYFTLAFRDGLAEEAGSSGE